MKTILVPTDGSQAAEKALDLALDLAKQHDATVTLMHVLLRDKEPDELLRLPDVAGAGDDVVVELERSAKYPAEALSATDLMSNTVKRPTSEAVLRLIGSYVLAQAHTRAVGQGVRTVVLDLVDGAPAVAIVAAAEAGGADTIVMGTRGLRQIEIFTFGSVSQEVCRTAPCTCVAVH